jgi:hypothetical protein
LPTTSASRKRDSSGVERGDQRTAASIEIEEVAFCASTYKRSGELAVDGEAVRRQVDIQMSRASMRGRCM